MSVSFIPSSQSLNRRMGSAGGGGGFGGGIGGGGGRGGGDDDDGGDDEGEGEAGANSGSGGSTGGTGSTSGSAGSISSGSTGSINEGTMTSVPLPKSVPGGQTSAVAYGGGTTKSAAIPSGQLFAGRTVGGATRGQIFGTSRYGSGYPGVNGVGVGGRNFPFFFWPVVYSAIAGETAEQAYLYDTEYGEPNNSSRPGGPLAQALFKSATSNNTFHIIADNTTVVSLMSSINANCSTLLSSSANNTQAMSYNSSNRTEPQPAQAVQYYRASSIVLTEDGYNNSATFSNDTNAPNTPLPSSTNSTLLDCLNQTIGAAAPLIASDTDGDGASTSDSLQSSHISFGGIGLLWMLLWMFKVF